MPDDAEARPRRLWGRRELLRTGGAAGLGVAAGAAVAADGPDSPGMDRDRTFSVRAYGAKGDGRTDDRAAIQRAFDAAGRQRGQVTFPPGDYVVSGPLVPRARTILSGTHTPRWEGGTRPPAGCAIRAARDFGGGDGLLRPEGGTPGVTVRNLALIGAGAGRSIDGLRMPDRANFEGNESWLLDSVTIAGFSGNGIGGCLQTTTLVNSMIHDNAGWGIDASGGNNWTDCHVANCFFFYNRFGNLNFGGTATSGFVEFANCRFERAGTDPEDVSRPLNAGAPGVRLTNARYLHFVNCTTDANCGNGFEIFTDDETPPFLPAFIGMVNCHLSRDGTGDGRTQPERAGLKVQGRGEKAAGQPHNVRCTNCFVTYGKADDRGRGDVVGPKYGVWHDRARAFQWIGGHVSVQPAGNEYRLEPGSSPGPALIDLERGLMTIPLERPSGSPPSGSMYLDEEAERLWVRAGDSWRSVALD